MKNFNDYRDASKGNWGTYADNLTLEQIEAGCLLRIADATEKMASNYQKMENDVNMYKRLYDEQKHLKEKSLQKIRALKGVITKLKKRAIKEKG